MTRGRGIASVTSFLLTFSLIVMPVWGATPAIGTLVSADRVTVGSSPASVGTTIFSGDQIATEQSGRAQVRAGAARLALSESSAVVWDREGETASATLRSGTATFSTANARALALHVGSAVIRPQGDVPTIGNVTVLGPKELVIRCSRGALTISVDDDTRVVQEGTAYRVVLDPNANANAASDAAAPWPQVPPQRAGRSRFVWYAIGFAAVLTWFAVSEALESPDRP